MLRDELVPVRLLLRDHPDVARRFSVSWTPTLVVLHHRGATVRQWVGFLPPDELLADLTLALALADLRSAMPQQAAARIDGLLARHSATTAAPEALYWKGVAAFRATGDKASLWEIWRQLATTYPDSPWALRTTLTQPDWVEHPAPAS